MSGRKLLYEDEVIDAVRAYLKRHGFSKIRHCTSTQRGDDIVASGSGKIRELYIEAKGATSKRKSKRHGLPFDKSQVLDHVANAFYRAAKMRIGNRTAGIALPDDQQHRRRIKDIQHILDELGVIVFWVDDSRRVTTSRPLE